MVDMTTRYIEYTYDPYRMGMEYDDRWLSPLSSTGTSPMKKKADKSELISAVRNLNQTSNGNVNKIIYLFMCAYVTRV